MRTVTKPPDRRKSLFAKLDVRGGARVGELPKGAHVFLRSVPRLTPWATFYRHSVAQSCRLFKLANLDCVLKMGSAGDSPAPLGDPLTGTAEAYLLKTRASLACIVTPVPSGGSPDGTGGSPVLPRGKS